MPGTRIEQFAAITAADPAVYYDVLVPDGSDERPWLVLVHGAAHTGACYLVTPDGRPGWAHNFARHGFRTAVPDWPGSGRSAQVPLDALDGEAVCRGLAGVIEALDGPVVVLTHSMSGAYGWRLIETCGRRIAAMVAVAPGPPGNIQPVPEVITRGADFVEIQGLAMRWRLPLDSPTMPDDALVTRKLIGDSTRFPRATTEAYRRTLRGIAPRLIYERQNVEGSQLRVEETANFAGKPILIVTGEHDIDHPREVDGAIADWLDGLGAAAEFCYLPDRGIAGNGHMMMLENNSAEIAALIVEWIQARAHAAPT